MEEIKGTPASADANIGGEVICPRCRFDTRRKAPDASEDDKREYLRAVLGNREFKKTYTVLVDGVSLTLFEPSARTGRRITSLLRGLVGDPDALGKALSARLVASCDFVRVGDVEHTPREAADKAAGVDDLLSIYDKIFGGLPESMEGQLFLVYNDFVALCSALAEGCLSENFWGAAGRS